MVRTLLQGRLVALCALLSSYAQAQYADFSIPSDFTTWGNDDWSLTTNRLIQAQFQSRAPMGNGYIGCGLAAAGPFFEADANLTDPTSDVQPINGWPLFNPRQTFCTVGGFFNTQHNTTGTNFPELLLKGGESVIAGIPNWPNLILQVGNATLDAAVDNSTISTFKSSRSFKTGLQQWDYMWSPSENVTIGISYNMFMDRSQPNVAAVQLAITPLSTVNVTVTDLIDGRGAVRSDPHATGMLDDSNTIYSAVNPHWINNVTAWIFSTVEIDSSTVTNRKNASESFYLPSNHSTIGQSWDIALISGGNSVIINKYVGIASTDGFADPETTAREASLNAARTEFGTLLVNSEAAWADLMSEDLIDDYSLPDGSLPNDDNVVNMQIITKANAHYLLQNLLPSNGSLNHWSVSVGGLGSDSYAGQVFWDADTFMSPGVLVSHPSYAAQIPNYRALLADQANINAVENGYSSDAKIYPWTSGRWGNCTGTGPCTDYEYHINSDIFLNIIENWRVTGDDTWFKDTGVPMTDSIVQMYTELVKYNETVGGYGIQNLTDPDEYANQVPDGAYTLASIAKLLQLATEYSQEYSLTVGSNWSTIADNIALPFAKSGILVEYLGANNTAVIKQDDVDLINYPLDYSSANYTEADKLTSLEYYANKQSVDGPAMTYSLYAISANALYPSGCAAFTLALNGFQPYVRAPWYQFSEQQVDNSTTNGGTNPAFPFMTGAGGWHQVGPMGWFGARIVESQLIIQPALPPQIPNLSLRTIIFGGTGIKATLNTTHSTITRVDVSKYLPPNSTDIYANGSMPITVGFSLSTGHNISIAMGQTLTIENRLYYQNVTTAGNLVQCLPVTSAGGHEQGQFPVAAIDGAASTRWQPLTQSPSSLTIDMRSIPAQPITGVSFDWGARPATAARVIMYNGTDSSAATTSDSIITISNITVSSPYNAQADVVITPYVGNMSFFTLATPIYSGDSLMLVIEGCQETGDTEGATVAEFNLFGTNGTGVLGAAAADSNASNGTSVPVLTLTPSTTTGAAAGLASASIPVSGGGGGSSGSATGTGSAGAATQSASWGTRMIGICSTLAWIALVAVLHVVL